MTIVLNYWLFFDFFALLGQMAYLALHTAISHLRPDEIDSLVENYLAGTRPAILLQQYRIAIAPNQLRKILPEKLTGAECLKCAAPMIEELFFRQGKLVRSSARCSVCRHDAQPDCRCERCREERYNLALENRKRQYDAVRDAILAVNAEFGDACWRLEDISLSQAVALLALTRCCPLNEQNVCEPIDASFVPFAPTVALRNRLLESLSNSGLIAVSEQSAEDTVQFDGKKLAYNSNDVRWIVRPLQAGELLSQIEAAGLIGLWPDHWHTEVGAMWLRLAMAECRQFYDYCAGERGLQPQGDVAVNAMLANILKDFSVSQCYRIIWNGAKGTADFMVRERPTARHAANYMIGSCQRWADHARTAGWTVYPFKRHSRLPRSMVSYVLFDVVLKIGECGFTEIVAQ